MSPSDFDRLISGYRLIWGYRLNGGPLLYVVASTKFVRKKAGAALKGLKVGGTAKH